MFTSLHVENPSVPGDYENLAKQGMVLGVSSGEVKIPGREAVRLIEGTAFAQVDLDDGRQVAVVPSTLWNQEYHVGDSLYIDSYVFLSSGNVDQQISTPFLVIGVYENEGNGAVFIPMQTFEKLTEKSLSFFAENGYDYFGQDAHPSYRWNQYFQEEVELASEADVPELKEALSQWNCEFEVLE
ncbi:MAG: ABC transporter permease [Solobacterium sp.]|nr:ABC transporter permease [Solobacterium sp.]